MGRPTESVLSRAEVEAALATRAELGPEYEHEVAEALAERIEQVIEVKVAERAGESRQLAKAESEDRESQFWLGLGSLGMAIPLTAVAGNFGDLPGIVASWAGIAAINVAFAITKRTRRD